MTKPFEIDLFAVDLAAGKHWLSGPKSDDATALAEWDEAKHPRADDGKFTDGEGGGSTAVYAPAKLHVNAEAQAVIRDAHTNDTELAKDAILNALAPEDRAKLAAVITHGEHVLPEFKRLLNDVGTELGVPEAPSQKDYEGVTKDRMFSVGPVKTLARAAEKVVLDYDGDVSRLNDVVRGTFVVSSPVEATSVLEAFQKRGDVLKVKNRFENPMAAGYRDMSFLVKLSSGMHAEVQVSTAALLRAKNTTGHQIYEKMRTLPEGSPKYTELLNESRQVYEKAWAESAKGPAS